MTLDADLTARFTEALDSPDVAERLDAVRALGRMGLGAEAEAVLARVADADAALSVRGAAARSQEALTRRLAVAAYDEPSREWLESADPARRLAVFEALGPGALEAGAVASVAVGDPELWVRAAALRALGATDDPAGLDLLRQCLADEEQGGLARGAALEALGRREPSAAAEAARRLVASCEGPVQRAAVRVLAATDPGWLLERLDGMLRGLDRRARAAAVWSLALVDDPRVEEVAIHALAQESDRELMEQEAALLLCRQSRSALGAAGVLRRSLDERVAAVASALYDQLLAVHRPGRDELAALEEAYLEERRRRSAAASLSSSSSSIPVPLRLQGRSSGPARAGLLLFVALAALVGAVALGRVLGARSPSRPGGLAAPRPGPVHPPSSSAAALGPGGTFGGRAVVSALRGEQGEVELHAPGGLVLRLRLEGPVPSWVRQGGAVLVTATGGRILGPTGVVYFERGRVEPAP